MKFDPNCSNCFAALSCSVRVEIINLLQEKDDLSVMEIVKHFDVSQSTITHHLKYLERSGVLSFNKVGRKVYYSIDLKCGSDKCNIFL